MKAIISLFLTAALVPLSAIKGQQTTTPQPQPTDQAAQGTHLEDDPAFQRLSPEQQQWVRKMTRLHTAIERKDTDAIGQLQFDLAKHQRLGMTFCGHRLDEATFIDALARNASGEEAFMMRWLDPKGAVAHTALFMGRCIAKDGDTIDGKVIVRVLPNSLALSDPHGLTAWEAFYRDNYGVLGLGHESPRGVFSERHFVAELDASKASEASADPDFRWNEDEETLALKPGIVLVPPKAQFSYAPALPTCPPEPAKQSGVVARLKKHLENTLEKQAGKADAQIAKGTGGNVDAGVNDTTTAAIQEINQPQPCTPSPAKH